MTFSPLKFLRGQAESSSPHTQISNLKSWMQEVKIKRSNDLPLAPRFNERRNSQSNYTLHFGKEYMVQSLIRQCVDTLVLVDNTISCDDHIKYSLAFIL